MEDKRKEIEQATAGLGGQRGDARGQPATRSACRTTSRSTPAAPTSSRDAAGAGPASPRTSTLGAGHRGGPHRQHRQRRRSTTRCRSSAPAVRDYLSVRGVTRSASACRPRLARAGGQQRQRRRPRAEPPRRDLPGRAVGLSAQPRAGRTLGPARRADSTDAQSCARPSCSACRGRSARPRNSTPMSRASFCSAPTSCAPHRAGRRWPAMRA